MEVQITNHAHQRFKERGYSKSQQKIQTGKMLSERRGKSQQNKKTLPEMIAAALNVI